MYNKIYRNMLFLCSSILAFVLLVVMITYYTNYKTNAGREFYKNAHVISNLISRSLNPQEIVEELEKTHPDMEYEIIESSVNRTCRGHLCITKELADGKTLHISCAYTDVYAPLYVMLGFILVMGVLAYLLSVRMASALTDSIVRPFTDMFASEDTYAEVLPLTRAIEFQNEEIKRQTENAQAREVELQLITDSMNEGLVIVDAEGNILSINNFASKVFGAEEYDVKHRHFTALLDNDVFAAAVEKALNSSRSNALIELGSFDYRVYCSPIVKNDITEGVIILLFDITSTYQSEKLRREFSANVSHELKTPLTSINGFAQIIAGGIAKTEDVPQFAAKIAKESNRLMILIEDIMRLSNLDEGAPMEPDSCVSVKEIVTETLNSLQEKAEQRNIAITFDGEDFAVTANRTQLSELIYNICDNAIKYNKDNGSVMVTLAKNSVSVSDTGIGIPQEYTERIFERFFRVDKSHSKKVDGTGLGLSIVKHIAKQNSIEIDVKSKLGEGSVFTIRFRQD